MKSIDKVVYYMSLGDYSGFPYENMSPNLIKKINPSFKNDISINNKLFSDDMITDDTEHTIITLLSLKETAHIKDDEVWMKEFSDNMRKKIKSWFLTFPSGIGKATLISCLKMLAGKKYPKTGCYSGGNGPLMRATMIGTFYRHCERRRASAIDISTQLTHNHEFSIFSSRVLSEISAKSFIIKHQCKQEILQSIKIIIFNELKKINFKNEDQKLADNFLNNFLKIEDLSKEDFIDFNFPKGVSGFCLNTLLFSIAMLYYNKDIEHVIYDSVMSGGDTDTNAGISASLCSLYFENLITPKSFNLSLIEKRINGCYFYRLSFSILGWIKSIYSLRYFMFALKK